ncbi:MAG: extracellular solute-binding protein [Treponema sp.]|nr:extracellular solute-binding protein [Treponema sp.]
MRKQMNGMMPVLGLLVFFLIGAPFVFAGGQQGVQQTAVSDSAANVNAPNVFPICKSPITLNLGIPQNSSPVENYDTNYYTLLLEEKGNLKLNFDIYPNGSPGTEKLMVMIAGGGVLPEVLVGFNFSEETMLQLGTEGVAIPLNSYYDKWAYEIPRQLEKVSNKDMWNWLHSADGNIYYVPYIQESIGEFYSLRGWMNQQWLANLGLNMPTTTDEFRTVLEAFRDKDPNKNGIKDEIPSAGNTDQRGRIYDFLINAFIYNDTRDRLTVDNSGKVDVIYNKPAYRDALRYINGLMNDGLMLDTIFTINGGQLRSVIEQKDVSTVGFFCAGLAGALAPNNVMRYEYTPMTPLKGPQGVQWTPYMPMGPSTRWVITKDCKNPEAAFRLGDYQCGEYASTWARYGRPDIDHRLARPGEKSSVEGFTPTVAEILPWGSSQNSHWYTSGPSILFLGLTDGQVASDNPLNNELWVSKAVPLYRDKAPPQANRVDRTLFTPQESDQIMDLRNTINGYVNENLAAFVMGQKSIERDWDSYVAELNRIGLSRYLDLTQSGYDRAIGKK